MKKTLVFSLLFFSFNNILYAQDVNALFQRVRDKLSLINNYEANAVMKTDVSFLHVPQSNVKVYFKKPDLLKIKNEKGISFVPKGAVSINLNNIISGDKFTIIDAGKTSVDGIDAKILKLLPEDENSNVILSTIYVDEKNALIIKAKTTIRDNGTYELSMKYGKYLEYGLPDDVIFIFNTKDYKMPKGITFDYDEAAINNNDADKNKEKQGKIELIYSSYLINKGVSEDVFK